MLWNNPFKSAENKQNQPQQAQVPAQPGTGQPSKGAQQQYGSSSAVVPGADDNNDDPNADPNKKKGGGDDPMLEFDNLWHPNKDAEGKEIVEDNSDDDSFLPQVDPKKFGELVGKMDFTKSITPEEWGAVKEGGDNGVKAIQSILNKANRHNFATMFNAFSRIAETGFKNAQGRFSKNVPDIVRDFMTDDGLSSDDGLGPIAQNSALSPLVKSVKQQYLKKFPKASPSQVNKAVKEYFQYAAKELSGGNKKQQPAGNNQDKLRKGEVDADFLQWIETEVGGVRGSSQNNEDAQN